MRVTKNQKGFSLVEMLIILVVISLFFSALMPLVAKNIAANYTAKVRLAAYEAAQTKVEELRNASFDTITSGTFATPTIPASTGTVTVTKDINNDGTNETDIVKATVNISYTLKATSKTINLITYISRKGISSVTNGGN